MPKAHYTFEFDSVYNPNVPGTILLDILFDSPHYPELIESTIDTLWLSVDGLLKGDLSHKESYILANNDNIFIETEHIKYMSM